MTPSVVAVIGTSTASAEEEATAFEVGRLLAGRDVVVMTGGRGGVMAAACRGARAGGGLTVGLLPGLDRAEANELVQVAIPTGLGELRNGLVVRAADALIAVGGAYGTLSEIALALRDGKTVVGLDTWELRRHGQPDVGIVQAGTPSEAVELALAAVGA